MIEYLIKKGFITKEEVATMSEDDIIKKVLTNNDGKIKQDIRQNSCTYRDRILRLSKADVIEFIKTHNAAIPISTYVQHYQFTKDELKNVLMQDTTMKRNSRILGGDIPCKMYMSRAIIRHQESVDTGFINYMIDFYEGDTETQYDILRYTLKFNGKRVASKNINSEKLKEQHPDLMLYGELDKLNKN